MRDAELGKISEAITAVLSKDFKNVRVIEVRVDDDVDFEGDAVLKIEVVFEGTPKQVDAGIVSSAIRHVRPALRKIGENAFPLFSFIAANELGSHRLERA